MHKLVDWLLNIVSPYKIALQYSGLPRAIEDDVRNYKQILNLNPDVYMHLWSEDINDKSPNKAVELFKPKSYLIEEKNRNQFTNLISNMRGHNLTIHGSDPYNSISQFYSREKCNELRNKSGIQYDLVIIVRTQLSFARDITRNELSLAKNNMLIPAGFDCGGINDLFTITCPKLADIYCSTYSNLQRLILDDYRVFHPHQTLRDRLVETKTPIIRIQYPLYLRGKLVHD